MASKELAEFLKHLDPLWPCPSPKGKTQRRGDQGYPVLWRLKASEALEEMVVVAG